MNEHPVIHNNHTVILKFILKDILKGKVPWWVGLGEVEHKSPSRNPMCSSKGS